MQSARALELLNKGCIEELKALLQDEIYQESLKKKPNAKKRYAAMKKYFSYTDSTREICQRPCEIEFEGARYNAFTNSYTMAFTTESTGEIELFDQTSGNYPDVSRLMKIEGEAKKVDLNKAIAEAKSLGYKLKKPEIFSNRCMLRYDGSYFRIALVDITYGIINDGEEATVYHVPNSVKPMYIETSIGLAMVLPINKTTRYEASFEDDKVIVEVE